MQSVSQKIELCSDYRIIRHCKRVDGDLAFAEICSEHQRDICEVIFHADRSLTLVYAAIVCPYCNYRHPIRQYHAIPEKVLEQIRNWCNPQLNFCTEDCCGDKLSFSPMNMEQYWCPNCRKQSDNSHSRTGIVVKRSKNKLSIRCEIINSTKVFELPYLSCSDFSISFPVFEQIDFNFRNGHTCIRLLAEDNEALFTRDITNDPSMLENCVLADWYYRFDNLQQIITDEFQSISGLDVLGSLSGLTLKDAVLHTRFIGYNRDFYSSIPFEKDTLKIDKSFIHVEALHTLNGASALLNSFPFSKYKSIRRAICDKQGMLFYLPECEKLFRSVNDINIFTQILKSPCAFDVFLTLHQHPLSIELYRDYCSMESSVSLYRKFLRSPDTWRRFKLYSLIYCSMSDYQKKKEQKRWKRKFELEENDMIQTSHYSLPMVSCLSNQCNCTVNGYSFRKLKNTAECYAVGRTLKNCLQTWSFWDSAIVAISDDKEVIAAIEIIDGTVFQAYSYKNGSISSIPGMENTIKEWALRNSITFDIDSCIC